MLTLGHAQGALAAMLAEARARGAAPLGLAVLDAGAHLLLFARMDGASLFRFEIAQAKARGALGMGADTRDLAARARDNPAFFGSVAAITGALALSAGGVIVRDAAGSVLGAIGVSGDTPDLDEAVARAGAAAITEEQK